MIIRFKEFTVNGGPAQEKIINIEDEEIGKILDKIFWIRENKIQKFLRENMEKIEVDINES